MLYKVNSLDVWGNEIDGYDVNNEFTIGEIELNNETDQELLLLLEVDFLKQGTSEVVEVVDFGEFIEIVYKANQKPLLFLYKINE